MLSTKRGAKAYTFRPNTPDALNQYSQAEDLTVTNGPGEHRISAFDGVTFAYTNDGRLAYAFNGTNWINFYYDALGRCVKRLKDGWAVSYSYYDGERELLECGTAGGAAFRNVYGKGIDEILMRKDTTKNWTFYHQQDHNGNVTELTNGSGVVVETFQYDAFGLLNKTVSGWGNPFLFTGRRYLDLYGIYEYRARAYHPRLGRFTSEDPKLFDAGDYNLFRYCHNDPVDLADPMGTENVPGQFWAPTPERMAASNDYNDMMAAAHWNMTSNNNSAGAIGVGSAGYQAWSTAGGLTMAQTKAQGGGMQYRYTAAQDRQGHRINYKDGSADFRWQANEYYPESKTLKPMKEAGLGNREIEIPSKRTGNIGTVIPSKGVTPLSSKGIHADHVAPVALDPGGTVHGTATFRNELYQKIGNVWVPVPGMTTQFTHTYDRDPNGAWHVDSQISSP